MANSSFGQSVKGLKGDKGDTGLTGATGATGEKGDTGAKGDTGPQGIQGDTGPNNITTSTTTNITGLLKGNGSTVEVGTITVSDVVANKLGTPTYTSENDIINTTMSSGRISGLTLSAHSPADGTLDISSGTGMIHDSNSIAGTLKFFNFAGQSSLALTDNTLNYIYLDYNSGTPVVRATTDRTTIHDYDQFTIGRCYREGTDASDITSSGTNIYNHYRRIHNRLVKKYGFDHASGSVVAESNTRKLSVTAGVWYIGNTEIITATHDSNAGYTFDTYYYNPTTALWVHATGVTQLGNTEYNKTDSGTGLATMTANKYANYWVYLCPAGDIYVLYGQAEYNTLAEAQATTSPAITPGYISANTRLIARITFKKSATNFSSISNVLTNIILATPQTQHNNLGGLQGGTTDEYYHLTSAQATVVSNTSGTNTGDQNLSGYALLSGATFTGGVTINVNSDQLDLQNGSATSLLKFLNSTQTLKSYQIGANATGYTDQRSSGILNFEASTWNGSAQGKQNFTIQNVAVSTSGLSQELQIKYDSSTIIRVASYGTILQGQNFQILSSNSTSSPAINMFVLRNTYNTNNNYSSISAQNTYYFNVGAIAFKHITQSNTVPVDDLEFWLANGGAIAIKGKITAAGSWVTQTGAIATNATDGFLYIPSCNGAPSGTPTTQTGTCALVYDYANNNLYLYNGAWKKVGMA